ncbi:hypothetical protein IV102_19090 [bacterium]|nr:hypothetical protein [bacterium]
MLALARDGKPRPTVLFYHGLHTQKETHRKELEGLAERGFLALGADAVQITYPKGRYEYREYAESDHFMQPEDWQHGWKRTLDWFEHSLRR